MSSISPFIFIIGEISPDGRRPEVYMRDFFNPFRECKSCPSSDRKRRVSDYNLFITNLPYSETKKAFNDYTAIISKLSNPSESQNNVTKILYCFGKGVFYGSELLKDTLNYWNKIYLVGPYLGGGKRGQTIIDNLLPLIQLSPKGKFFLSTTGGTFELGDAMKEPGATIEQAFSQKRKIIQTVYEYHSGEEDNRVQSHPITDHGKQNYSVIEKMMFENPLT